MRFLRDPTFCKYGGIVALFVFATLGALQVFRDFTVWYWDMLPFGPEKYGPYYSVNDDDPATY